MAQWLRLGLPKHRVQVQTLVGELGSHMPRGQTNQSIKLKQYCNKFNKDFKNGPQPQEAGIYSGEKIASSISGAGKTEQIYVKE